MLGRLLALFLLVLTAACSGSSTPLAAPPSPAPAPVVPPVTQFGATYTYPDGLAVTVGAPTALVPRYEPTIELPAYVAFAVTVLNGTTEPYDAGLFSLSVPGGTLLAPAHSGLDARPTTPVPPGGRVTFTSGYGLQVLSALSAEARPGLVQQRPPVPFTGGAAPARAFSVYELDPGTCVNVYRYPSVLNADRAGAVACDDPAARVQFLARSPVGQDPRECVDDSYVLTQGSNDYCYAPVLRPGLCVNASSKPREEPYASFAYPFACDEPSTRGPAVNRPPGEGWRPDRFQVDRVLRPAEKGACGRGDGFTLDTVTVCGHLLG